MSNFRIPLDKRPAMPHNRDMNTYTDGQTYTFTDWKGEVCVWVRTNGVWVSQSRYPDRDDVMIAGIQACGFGEVQ